ncbi:MAG TPA: hypothetical protein PKM44_08490 [Turneriella sp.]|nr:hypothetical protein [Turneriella sp.]HNE18694.1 hypothetical protein [Turneriella sp.]HNL10536.1 hypothetical protein [Turneriella sp.]HNL54101.1 hypothetical protein [Turneriella sp.]HNM99369.1 hypothetical protein [Turneriella sp.]
MTKRNLLIVSLLAVVAALIFLFLKPCAPAEVGQANEGGFLPALKNKLRKKPAAKETAPAEVPVTEAAPAPAAAPAEVDTAPPVNLSGSDEIPNVAKCVSANFPTEAKPYVKTATVNVRLVVDKYGNVRSVKTTSVEFPEEPAEDMLPMLRKLFIQAGNRAFGSKKCPPHVVNGQNVGYAIEVPLQYRH